MATVQRIAVHTVITHVNGKRVKVKPGEKFDFDADEAKELEARGAIRKAVNESESARSAKVPAKPAAGGGKDEKKPEGGKDDKDEL